MLGVGRVVLMPSNLRLCSMQGLFGLCYDQPPFAIVYGCLII